MSRLPAKLAVLIAALGISALGAWAQGALTAKLEPNGLIRVSLDGAELAVVELNAHGSGWQYAAQATATAQVSALPAGGGHRCVGTLPIPNTEGGTLRYTETVKSLPQGLALEYDVEVGAVMRLSGLQVSILLPADRYGGREVVISAPQGEAQITSLPRERQTTGAGVWSGQGAKIEVAAGTEDAVTIELRAATDVVIQDLRQWDRPEFEIRFPAIMEDPGREVTPEDRFHLDLTVTFAGPVTLAAQ